MGHSLLLSRADVRPEREPSAAVTGEGRNSYHSAQSISFSLSRVNAACAAHCNDTCGKSNITAIIVPPISLWDLTTTVRSRCLSIAARGRQAHRVPLRSLRTVDQPVVQPRPFRRRRGEPEGRLVKPAQCALRAEGPAVVDALG